MTTLPPDVWAVGHRLTSVLTDHEWPSVHVNLASVGRPHRVVVHVHTSLPPKDRVRLVAEIADQGDVVPEEDSDTDGARTKTYRLTTTVNGIDVVVYTSLTTEQWNRYVELPHIEATA